jgi:DNA-binding NarL/FixJ family response regulator
MLLVATAQPALPAPCIAAPPRRCFWIPSGRPWQANNFVLPADGSQALRLTPRLAKNLTPRELKILELLMEGSKNRRIAEHLDVAEHVVKDEFQKIFDLTGFSNRLELALFLSNCR